MDKYLVENIIYPAFNPLIPAIMGYLPNIESFSQYIHQKYALSKKPDSFTQSMKK